MVSDRQKKAISEEKLVRSVYKGGNGLCIYFSKEVLALYGLHRDEKVKLELCDNGILLKPYEEGEV